MISPFKRIIVYDLETGGLNLKYNSITEIAGVVIDLETLEIIDEFSTILKPRLDLSNRLNEPIKEARELFKILKIKDTSSNLNILPYKGDHITLKNLQPLIDDIKKLYPLLKLHGDIIYYKDFLQLKKNEELEDILELYFDKCYNPQALEITNISRDMLISEGVGYEEGFCQFRELINKHTIGNSKPIIAGHNIGSLPRRIERGKEKAPDGFDNPFMEVFFKNNKDDFFYCINDKIIDTLKEARLKWYELPSYSLGVCANAVGLTLKDAHRALPDTKANAKLLIKMLKSLRGEGSQKSSYKRRKYNFNF